MEWSKWVESLMDVDRAPLEFTGDDVNRFTSVIDLEWPYEFVTVILPIMVVARSRFTFRGQKLLMRFLQFCTFWITMLLAHLSKHLQQ